MALDFSRNLILAKFSKNKVVYPLVVLVVSFEEPMEQSNACRFVSSIFFYPQRLK